MTKYNIWFFSSVFIALIVALPIVTVSFSFLSETSNYFLILKNTVIIGIATINAIANELNNQKLYLVIYFFELILSLSGKNICFASSKLNSFGSLF